MVPAPHATLDTQLSTTLAFWANRPTLQTHTARPSSLARSVHNAASDISLVVVADAKRLILSARPMIISLVTASVAMMVSPWFLLLVLQQFPTSLISTAKPGMALSAKNALLGPFSWLMGAAQWQTRSAKHSVNKTETASLAMTPSTSRELTA